MLSSVLLLEIITYKICVLLEPTFLLTPIDSIVNYVRLTTCQSLKSNN